MTDLRTRGSEAVDFVVYQVAWMPAAFKIFKVGYFGTNRLTHFNSFPRHVFATREAALAQAARLRNPELAGG